MITPQSNLSHNRQTYNFNTNRYHKKQSQKINFGQISPEHLFIRIDGFGKNKDWAKAMVNTINQTKNEICSENLKLKDILDNIAASYQNFFLSNGSHIKKTELTTTTFDQYGSDRVHNSITPLTDRFELYQDKAKKLFKKNPALVHQIAFDDYKEHTGVGIKLLADVNGGTPMTRVVKTSDLPKPFKEKFKRIPEVKENKSIFILMHTNEKNIPSLLEHSEKQYNDIIKFTQSKIFKNKTPDGLNKFNEKIGELYWNLANTMPYRRGSAGIVDIFSKCIYEKFDIQVSKWKKNVSPDVEAMITPDAASFKKSFVNLFERPPEFMHNN